jgi:hypothetical protein
MAPCDFFLFGHLKKKLEGKLRSQKWMISPLIAILSEIPVRTFSGVFDEWIERLHGCSTNGGEHV